MSADLGDSFPSMATMPTTVQIGIFGISIVERARVRVRASPLEFQLRGAKDKISTQVLTIEPHSSCS